jgi:ubiquinone/menaquinone biosynthesis C-methylase UbiE
MEKQQEIWEKIAPEWHKYKEKPSRLSEEFLKKQTGNVLDLGSGSGRHLTKIKNGEMFLVDFSKTMLKLAKQKAKKKSISAKFHEANIAKLPFENNLFDAAISISAIHCTPPPQHKKIVKELYRVLKPKAKALIGVWNKESKRFKRYKTKERYIGWTTKGKRYYYLFTEPEIHKLFKDAGFKILSTHNSELMINFIAQKP